jgi:hypothetical protein
VARAAPKTVRFTRVVERSGRPHVHTLWLPPDKDPEFKRARDTHRLMTIEQTPGGGKADFGVVGYDAKHDAGGQFLIFPKSLKRFEGARVVGVKFDLVELPKLAAARTPKPKRSRSSSRAKSRRTRAQRPRPRSVKAPASLPPRLPAAVRKVMPLESVAKLEKPSPPDVRLKRELREAMKELQRGKNTAARQRLERALQK